MARILERRINFIPPYSKNKSDYEDKFIFEMVNFKESLVKIEVTSTFI